MKTRIKLEVVSIEDDGLHLFLPARINGRQARFLVDTGASRTVVDQARIVEKFKVDGTAFQKLDTLSAGLGTNTMESHLIVLNTLSFGRMILKDYKAAALDLKHVNQSFGQLKFRKIDGVIGGDLLHRLKAVIDYKRKEIRLG